MKRIFTLLLIMCLFIGTTAKAQQFKPKENDFKLSIIQAEIDGEDYSDLYIENNVFLVFYEYENELHFANVWQKTGTQSYGAVSILKFEDDDEAEYPTQTVSMRWKYSNSYDDKTGVSLILMRLTKRPLTEAFELSMITESGEVLEFKGFVSGESLFE